MIKVVEYDHNQKAFKITNQDDMLEKNLRSVIEQQPMYWIPIAFFNNHEKACEFIEGLERKHGKRHTTIEERDKNA